MGVGSHNIWQIAPTAPLINCQIVTELFGLGWSPDLMSAAAPWPRDFFRFVPFLAQVMEKKDYMHWVVQLSMALFPSCTAGVPGSLFPGYP